MASTWRRFRTNIKFLESQSRNYTGGGGVSFPFQHSLIPDGLSGGSGGDNTSYSALNVQNYLFCSIYIWHSDNSYATIQMSTGNVSYCMTRPVYLYS